MESRIWISRKIQCKNSNREHGVAFDFQLDALKAETCDQDVARMREQGFRHKAAGQRVEARRCAKVQEQAPGVKQGETESLLAHKIDPRAIH
ncbi:hypothetical protein [Rhizobium rhizosphaerae]|uniref:hypothetical protein n=1 Tax=Xaviernesmea rhizosphaerae TaxID=1672749 RepID=UPI0011190777|nr:hypothetical protein [Xaviernesmea rhizosphaerae]